MNRENKYLSDRYEKILDLAEHIDEKMVSRIEHYLSTLEDRAIHYIKNEQSFHRTTRDNSSFLFFEVNDSHLDLELAQGGNDGAFVLRKLNMAPLNRETLSYLNSTDVEDRSLRLIHFTISNAPHDPMLKMHVTQDEDGSYILNGIGTNRVLCFEYQLDLSYVNGKYVLSSTKFISTVEQYNKEIEMSEMDLVDYTSPMGSVNQAITPDDLNGNVNKPRGTSDLSDLSEEEIKKIFEDLTDFFS